MSEWVTERGHNRALLTSSGALAGCMVLIAAVAPLLFGGIPYIARWNPVNSAHAVQEALALILGGVALLAMLRQHCQVAASAGAAVIAVGLYGLLTGADGAGQLSLSAAGAAAAPAWYLPQPGLWAVSTMLLGAAMVTCVLRTRRPAVLAFLFALGGVAVLQGLAALVLWTWPVPTMPVRLPLVETAPLFEAGLLLLGVGLQLYAVREQLAQGPLAPLWLPLAVGVGTLALVFLAWNMARGYELEEDRNAQWAHAHNIMDHVESELAKRAVSLSLLARQWPAGKSAPRVVRAAWADLHAAGQSGFLALEWIGPDDRVLRVSRAPGEGPWRVPDPAADPPQRAALRVARESHQFAVAPVILLSRGQRVFRIIEPIYDGERLQGFLSGVLEVEPVFGRLVRRELPSGYEAAVFRQGVAVYSTAARQPAAGDYQVVLGSVGGTTFQVGAWPDPGNAAGPPALLSQALATLGVILAGLLALLTYLVQRAGNQTAAAKRITRSLQQEIGVRREMELERDVLVQDMQSRIRELRCLFGIAGVIRREGSLEQMLLDASRLIPTGFQFRPIVRARVRLEDRDYAAEPFEETPWSLTCDILIGGKPRGAVEVFMLERLPVMDIGPFLAEERQLLGAIAQTLGDAIERRHAEAELQESEERFRNLIEGSLQGTVILRGPKPLFANRAFANMLGYDSVEEVLAEPSLARLLDPDEHERIRNLAGEALRHSQELPMELSSMRRDGRRIRMEVFLRPVNWQGSAAIQATALDITERTVLEEQFRQAQKMEAVGQLAGGVAHDFNNLLQVVRGYTELARRDVQAQPTAAGHLDRVLKALDGAGNLTRQLLAFSRRQVLARRHLDLDDLVAGVGQMLRPVLGVHIELEVRAGEAVDPVYADAGVLEQALINMCLNARDAMPHGGRLRLAVENRELDAAACKRLGAASPGRYVQVTVSDTGVGMPRDVREHIFEPFFTTKEAGRGTGLGLSMVYGMVQQHKGVIEVESRPGAGSTFRICLPAAAGRSEPAAQSSVPALAGGSETLLLAEDDAAVRALVVRLLEDQGYRVLTAADGQDAVEAFSDQPERIGLVILDMVMPRMSGRAAYERIRALRPGVPVLFSTGNLSDGADAEYVTNHALPVIQKPYTPNDLFRAVRQAIAGHPPA